MWLEALAGWRKQGRAAAREGEAKAAGVLGRRPTEALDRSMADYADGEGLAIGPDQERTSTLVPVADGESWIEFSGLWGRRSILWNESGPPGPKWKREEHLAPGEKDRAPRLLWEDSLRWLAETPRRARTPDAG